MKLPNNYIPKEELAKMFDTPVYILQFEKDVKGNIQITEKEWCVTCENDNFGFNVYIPNCDHYWYELKDYGITWLAYKEKI